MAAPRASRPPRVPRTAPTRRAAGGAGGDTADRSGGRAERPLRLLAGRVEQHLAGHEARAGEGDHASLRLWLRLLACATQIETEIRRRLRAQFGTTLPRFDYLAQLHRHPDGLRMNELSRHLMVTGGSVTGLTDQLQKDGWVQRASAPDDRRAFLLSLTPTGRAAFERMAAAHEAWVVELLGGLNAAERRTLHGLLGRLRVTTAERAGTGSPSASPAAGSADPTDDPATAGPDTTETP